jgi:serine/threonine-protein kinase
VPFIGLSDPGGVTVDNEGSVYVTNRGDNRVLKLPNGSSKQVELHVTGIDYPWGLAVDNIGTVYVGGRNNKVVALRQS